ncbi:MAG: 4Fe-4S dicluster domain-containing protein [Armatimonadota bacterium]|nr:4Fe-4S dicluster domain-containing protein [Armatimonadota bacterium]MDW8026152.1 4Fe-4S dicluster domain-containing protein [Armatimonadota bacterium]
MRILSLRKETLKGWCERMKAAGMRIAVPMQRNGIVLFEDLVDLAEFALPTNYIKSNLSPKSFLFPPTEPLLCFRFKHEEIELEDVQPDAPKTVLLFIRPCDAAGISALAKVFLDDPPDVHFYTRLERTTLVALACDAIAPSCFCTAAGYSPYWSECVDVIMSDVDDAYLLTVLTNKGEELIQTALELFSEAGESQIAKVKERQASVESQLPPSGELTGIADRLIANFENELWEKMCRRCLSCGACTYVCPSCSCFDIADEDNPYGGCRYRNWDGCCFTMFTMHASGHNPRPTQAHRYRQRTMHKFSYFPLRYGVNMCVGCGRCIDVCPVGMDIYEVAKTLASAKQL